VLLVHPSVAAQHKHARVRNGLEDEEEMQQEDVRKRPRFGTHTHAHTHTHTAADRQEEQSLSLSLSRTHTHTAAGGSDEVEGGGTDEEREAQKNDLIFFVAMKAIKQGDEVFFDYNRGAGMSASSGKVCCCLSPSCRKVY